MRGQEKSEASTSTNVPGNLNKSASLRCVPVISEHINRYGDRLSVWGVAASVITFVGIVRKIEVLSSKVNFELEDNLGRVRGLKWLVNNKGHYKCPVDVNKYARVHGNVRSTGTLNYILILSIEPIQELNEILCHLMEVTVMSLEGRKIAAKEKESDKISINNVMDVSNNTIGLDRDQTLIIDIIRHGDSEYGVERKEIKAKVPSYSSVKVDQIIEFLLQEGHIYTTITDDHFKII